jgi:dihydrodipicolinate synthase/N-acetylneuraminate lyase
MITGSIVALVTPMHADGSVDWDSLERLLDWHIAAAPRRLAP